MQLKDKHTHTIVEAHKLYGGLIGVDDGERQFVDIEDNYYPVGAWQEVEPERNTPQEDYPDAVTN